MGSRLLRGFIDKRIRAWCEPSTRRATPTEPRTNPLTGLPRSRTLASFHRGALPLQSSHRLSPPDSRRADSPSFRRPIGIRARAPSPRGVEQVVRDPPRLRPRAFSTPRRFSQAHVPRLYFAPQPVLGCLSSSFPLAEIAHLFPGRFAPLRFLTRVPNATSQTLSPPVSLNRHVPSRRSFQHAPAEFPRRLWVPFHPAEAELPVALDPRDRDRSYRELSPLRSFDPPANPFTRSRVTPPPRPLLALGPLQRLTTFTSDPRTHPTGPEGPARHPLTTLSTPKDRQSRSVRREGTTAQGSSPSTRCERTRKRRAIDSANTSASDPAFRSGASSFPSHRGAGPSHLSVGNSFSFAPFVLDLIPSGKKGQRSRTSDSGASECEASDALLTRKRATRTPYLS